MNQENNEDDISDIQEAVAILSEKVKSVSKRASELERDIKQIPELKANADVRLKMLEDDVRRMSDDFSDMDKKMRTFELSHNSGRERWSMIVNFGVQLTWVVMAAFLLTKLGLQAPL